MCVLFAIALGACEDAPPKPAEAALAVPVRRVTTLGSGLGAQLPVDLLVQPFQRSLFATSPDGGYRFYLADREGSLDETFGAFKDELLGLGWEAEAEQHFASAVRIDLFRGTKQLRTYRRTWIVALPSTGKPRTAVCEGVAREAHRPRLEGALRNVCEGLEVK